MFKLIGAVILIAVIVAIFQALAESGILTIIGIAIAVFVVARIGWGIYKKSKAEKTEPVKPAAKPATVKPDVKVVSTKTFKTKIAGVKACNKDKSQRQEILKQIYEEGYGVISYETYEYEGEDAVAVEVDGKCIGNIPKARVEKFIDIMLSISGEELNVEQFWPDDEDGCIYRADLIVTYED